MIISTIRTLKFPSTILITKIDMNPQVKQKDSNPNPRIDSTANRKTEERPPNIDLTKS